MSEITLWGNIMWLNNNIKLYLWFSGSKRGGTLPLNELFYLRKRWDVSKSFLT